MSEEKFVGVCQWCTGSGVEPYTDSEGNPLTRSCTHCGADGKIMSSSGLDTTEIMDEFAWLKRKIKKILNKLELPED